jgi:hypothetical protein
MPTRDVPRRQVSLHQKRSQAALERLDSCGFTPQVLQRLGALAVAWAIFERNLEVALWALTGEQVKGVQPSTDKLPISKQIELLKQQSTSLSRGAQGIITDAASAACDLMDYRHAIMHGAMLPSAVGGPSFIRNPRWHGEKRARPTHDAHVDENLLDLAIDTAWTLCRLVFTLRKVSTDASSDLEELKGDMQRAKSQANELRHLTEIMNSEKY